MKLAAWILLSSLLLSMPAHAADDGSREADFARATLALEKGDFKQAIDLFELLADKGFVHPDASFNRAIAYVTRAESNQARPGDLGRAAAALEEVQSLRRGDDEAAEALRLVREKIGRRRAQEGAKQVVVSPSLSRAIVALLPEYVWALLALIGSLLSSVGLGLRIWLGKSSARLAGGVAVGVGGLLLLVGGGLAFAARQQRLHATPAVVVVNEARLLDASGKPLGTRAGEHQAIIEGAKVLVLDEEGFRARVEWGNSEGWVNRAQLQRIHQPGE